MVRFVEKAGKNQVKVGSSQAGRAIACGLLK